MKRKLKTNCSIVRMFGMFECGRLMRSIIAAALCAVGFDIISLQMWESVELNARHEVQSSAIAPFALCHNCDYPPLKV